jgi:ribulose-phosphate 3-epimerase
MKKYLAVSILNADFNNLQKEIEIINNSNADWIHLDIMDGVFVPNISFGLPIVESVKKIAKKPLDVHLMLINPERYIKNFHDAGADILSVHLEASPHLQRSLCRIKELGIKAGIVINPHTTVSNLTEVIKDADLVLNMTVNPGYGGQKFIENSYEKISKLKELIIKKNSNALIEVDGGIDPDKAKKLYDHGVDIIVAGSSIFGSEHPKKIIKEYLNIR